MNLGTYHTHEGGHREQLVDLAPIRCEPQSPELLLHEYSLILWDILGNVQQVLRHGGADIKVDEDENRLQPRGLQDLVYRVLLDLLKEIRTEVRFHMY